MAKNEDTRDASLRVSKKMREPLSGTDAPVSGLTISPAKSTASMSRIATPSGP